MNKKSFHRVMGPNPEEFTAVFFTPEGKASFHEGTLDGQQPGGFEMTGNVWEAMLEEPGLRAKLDEWVEKKAAERVEKELQAKSEDVEREAKGRGFELGRSQALADSMDTEERLKTICDSLMAQTNQIVRQHEKIWIEALNRTLTSFLIDRTQPKIEMIEAWVTARREEFLQKGRLVVYLSPEDFGGSLPVSENGKWEWRLDTGLKSGQIRAEAEGAGIFYSPEAQWRALDELLDRAMRGAAV